MVEDCKLDAKVTNKQLKKLKTENKTKTTLKIFDGSDLLHELLLTTRQKTKLRNAFHNTICQLT